MFSKHNLREIRAGILPVLVLLGLLFTGACKKNPNHPGYVYLPDMDESRAYETYSENPVFDDGKTLRPPVEGTIPRGHEPFPYVKTEEDLLEAGLTLVNPLEASEELLERGEVLYSRFCSHCHGDQGNGQGILFTSGRFTYPPGDLTAEKVINRPDGEIYHIITVGYGIMGAHGNQILPEDRWKIINYVREVIQDSTALQ